MLKICVEMHVLKKTSKGDKLTDFQRNLKSTRNKIIVINDKVAFSLKLSLKFISDFQS